MVKEELTGIWYFKKGFFGGCFWVEYKSFTYCDFDNSESPPVINWKKAGLKDLRELGIYSY